MSFSCYHLPALSRSFRRVYAIVSSAFTVYLHRTLVVTNLVWYLNVYLSVYLSNEREDWLFCCQPPGGTHGRNPCLHKMCVPGARSGLGRRGILRAGSHKQFTGWVERYVWQGISLTAFTVPTKVSEWSVRWCGCITCTSRQF